MTIEEFDRVVESRLVKVRKILVEKGREYCPAREDRLVNFKTQAGILQSEPEQALLGNMVKQFGSVVDYVKSIRTNPQPVTAWDEKIGDCINYLILLEALVGERYFHDPPVL